MMAATYFQMVKQKSVHTCREGDTKQMWLNAHVSGKYVGIPILFFPRSYLFEEFLTIKLGKSSQDPGDCQLTKKLPMNNQVSD